MSEKLFYLEDKIMKQYGLYAMWTSIYIANLVVLLVDDTDDESRDFNILVNGLSVLYGSVASVNVIFGNKLPSTMLLIAGPIHQYLFWMIFAYFGGAPVLGSHPIGVMNWFSLFLVGIFTLDMVIKTWTLSFYPELYNNYVKNTKNDNIQRKGNKNIQKVIAKFTFKDDELENFNKMLQHPETGLSLTKKSEGFISIECLQSEEKSNILFLSQKWENKQNHIDYVNKRKEMGMFDTLQNMLVCEPEILYVYDI